jgi:pyruvate kinase
MNQMPIHVFLFFSKYFQTNLVSTKITTCKKYQGRHSIRAVLLDTKGPEVRSGKLQKDKSGHETIHLVAGNTITLHTASEMKEQGTETDLYIDYPKLHKSLSVGMKVLLDDGAVALIVTEVETGMELHGKVKCIIENSGELRSRAGVNLPGADTDLPAMSDKDKVDIKYGMTMDVDYVAASFVQNAEAVHEIRAHIQKSAKELGWADDAPLPLIISKIESMSALKHFDAILEASDGIMVARGDLGVEVRDFCALKYPAFVTHHLHNICAYSLFTFYMLRFCIDSNSTSNECPKGDVRGMQCRW